ncbi:Mur ligase family protein [Methanobacterium aggregans]|uniref:Mur ligase family protein n=1 Tax=Methanobacterium aggregans TaxID=1615586 RepID=UPI001AE3B0D9|nr:Mur ligase family protein [Methanobacterium aggregans]MBP2045561.1 UDP-N-acetylmuramoyl-L-alanyl-D-glutamate--2,6-diaminopimelate ligase [Methanobacterium aggregans]
MEITTSYLAQKIDGKLFGPDKRINGIFNFLGDARHGDAVVRHWINEKGIEIAVEKGVSCIVTQNPHENAVETAEKLDLPLIVTERIELANAFAIEWAVKRFADDALRIVVTGTNGKSTTTHMIHKILEDAGYNTYTNTDPQSEFNTLIDPIVGKQIAEFPGKIEAMVVEVSEVQGWLDNLMKDHAQIMTSAVDPEVVVLTNVSLDHIGLVNSIEEAFHEISGAVKALASNSNTHEKTFAILNKEDPLIKKMANMIGPKTNLIFYGNCDSEKGPKCKEKDENDKGCSEVEICAKGITHNGDVVVPLEKLPFKSKHFLQNTMASVGAALAVKIPSELIEESVSSYKPLKRRFSVLHENPTIIDDFAHNPDGIIATIKSAAESLTTNGHLYIVSAIRGSRGESINSANAQAIAEGLNGLKGLKNSLIVTSSLDVVDMNNTVKPHEKRVFLENLEKRGLKYEFHEKLQTAVEAVLKSAKPQDTILLIGAQGMDPVSDLLDELIHEDV